MSKKNLLTHSKKKQAFAFFQAKQPQEAKLLYSSVCQLDPLDAEAWFMLGTLNAQLGAAADAEACFRRAAAIQPRRPEIHYNLAKTLEIQGRDEQALQSYREALRLKPDFAAAYTNMGALYQARGQFEEALASHREAVRLAPLAEAHYNLGNVLKKMARFEEAAASYRAALRVKPDFVEAHNNLGIVLYELYRLDEAAESYEKALRFHPDAMVYFNLGNVRLRQMKLNQAVASYRQALRLDPNHAEAHNNLGNAFRIMNRHEGVLASYREALRLKPDYVDAHTNLGFLLMEYGRLDEALASFRRALHLNPGHVKAAAGEATIYERQGDYEKAYARLQPFLESGNETADVALAFSALCRHIQRCQDAIAMLERILARDGSSLYVHERISLHFELGRLLDAAADYDRAFAHYRQGNVLKGRNFDPEVHAREIEDIIQTFNADFMAAAPRAAARSRRPIFIVGMPRSGTSLVEQILASHPQVYGAGELDDMRRIVDSLAETLGSELPYPQCVSALTAETCNLLSRRYLDRLAELSPDAARVTDKMPSNFLHLGLIALLFPEARVIHCVRDPLDTCLSCYFQPFGEGQDFSYDLGHLGAFYRQYQRLMRHWEAVLDIAVMKVGYEQLVAEQEKVSRAMLEFCDLDWDERCLQFYDTRRVVATASYDQVRQPLYQKSIGRWRHYDRHLGPLKEALAGG